MSQSACAGIRGYGIRQMLFIDLDEFGQEKPSSSGV